MKQGKEEKQCLGCFRSYGKEFTVCPHCGYVENTPVEEPLHMEPGSILRERYTIGKVLGFGGFGVTYIGWDPILSVKVAIKEYLPSEFSTRMVGQTAVSVYNGNKAEQFQQGMERFVDEAKRLAKFSHETGIVKVYDSFMENNTAYIVMEYLEGETLAEKIRRSGTLPAQEVLSLLMPVMYSLEAVHKSGIVHRDIAPDNIMVTEDGEAKLIDFGAARYATTSHSRSLTVIIKEGYSPEEQYRSRGEQGAYTDVYAIAATIYKAITGITPPDALERRVYCENKKKDPLKDINTFETDLTEIQQIALMNALNVRIEDRTPDMETFLAELTAETKPFRRLGKIKRVDFLKWPLWAKIGLPTVAAGAVALGVVGTMLHVQYESADIPTEMVRVPAVINSKLDDGADKLSSSVLLARVIGAQSSTIVPEQIVMSQNKGSGSYVLQNTVVGMEISTGVENNLVPNVTGMYEEMAISELEQAGYSVNTEEVYSSVIAEGAVISQDIDPGSEYDLGEIVTLTVSQGTNPDEETETQMIEMPDLSDKTFSEAVEAMEQCGMQIAVTSREYSDTVAEDAILYQSLLPKQKLMNQNTVEVMVSKGGQTIRVENVFCQTEEDATETLRNQGLTVSEVIYESSELYEQGLVIAQSPEPGEESELNASVSLTVSSGCAAFTMPDVLGMPQEKARETLLKLGLVVTIGYDMEQDKESGIVLAQDLKSGEAAMPGDVVVLTVNAEPDAEIVEIPDVTGMEQKKASQTLGKQDLRVAVSEAYSDEVESGVVISQMPPAGVSVVSSGVVTLTVSMGSATAAVPDVLNRSQTVAESMLEDQGFKVKIETAYSDTVTRGMVISQSPEAAETLQQGETVKLVISKGKEPVTIPNVVGKTKEEAIKALTESHLTYTVHTAYSDTVPKDCVISQIPEAGQKKLSGDKIVLVVSIGKASVMPTGITLNESTRTMTAGDSFQLISVIQPENASDKAVNWSSSNPTVASVSENGLVKAVAEGTAVITAKTNSGGKTAAFQVTVKKPEVESITISAYPSKLTYYTGETLNTSGLRLMVVYSNRLTEMISSGFQASCDLSRSGEKQVSVTYEGLSTSYGITVLGTDISISASSLSLAVGDTYRLSAVNSTGGTVTWSSSNSSVASVADGAVVAHGAGSAVITASMTYQGTTYKAECSVSVQEHITGSVSLSAPGRVLNVGETVKLSCTVSPSGQSVSWKSSNPGCVSVDGNGNIKALTGGDAVITVSMTYKGSSYSDSCTVTVQKPSLSLSQQSLSLYAGQTATLTASTNLSGAKIQFSSNNPGVVTCGSDGTVKASAQGGSAVITVTMTDANGTSYHSQCEVTVTALSIASPPNLSLYPGESGTIPLSGVPGVADVKWKSSDLGVVQIDNNGNYVAKAAGDNVTLTATVTLGMTYYVNCTVTVNQPYITITSYPTSILHAQDRGTLGIAYDAAGQVDVEWHSSNPACVSVGNDGSYTAISPGKTTISVRFVLNGITYEDAVELQVE